MQLIKLTSEIGDVFYFNPNFIVGLEVEYNVYTRIYTSVNGSFCVVESPEDIAECIRRNP